LQDRVRAGFEPRRGGGIDENSGYPSVLS